MGPRATRWFNLWGYNNESTTFSFRSALGRDRGLGGRHASAALHKAPPPQIVSPAYNWSGFYIGAMGGYGWGSGDSDGSGGFGGGTIGYNWQFPGSQFVFGIEVDAAGASIKDSFTEDSRRWRPAHAGTTRSTHSEA